jgi:hypothetical protein
MANRQNHRLVNAKKTELKRQASIDAGLVSECFPSVSGITIHITYYRNTAVPVIMVRTVYITPSSCAYFKMDCMIRDCKDGGFDLTSVIGSMVKTRKTVKKGRLVCSGKVDTLEVDHASIEYEAAIQYLSR